MDAPTDVYIPAAVVANIVTITDDKKIKNSIGEIFQKVYACFGETIRSQTAWIITELAFWGNGPNPQQFLKRGSNKMRPSERIMRE